MDDDFNTANAISVLFELAKSSQLLLNGKNYLNNCYQAVYEDI